MKKAITLFIVLTMAVFSLTACGSSEDITSAKPSSDKEISVFDKNGIEVTFLINCIDVVRKNYDNLEFLPQDGKIIAEQTYKVVSDTTILELTQAVCEKENIELDILTETYGDLEYTYVSSIANLKNGAINSMGHWMFTVNEITPSLTSDNYSLSDGDVVTWYYNPGDESFDDEIASPYQSEIVIDSDCSVEVTPSTEIVPDDGTIINNEIVPNLEVVPDEDVDNGSVDAGEVFG